MDDTNDRTVDAFVARQEFEAALPLYVGGDLTADEIARVELWIAEHPEDREALESAEAAYGLLRAHAEKVRAAVEAPGGPDLWPNLRAQLRAEGLVDTGRDAAASPSGWNDHARGPRALESVPRSWVGRRSFAAAAALLLCGGLAAFLAAGRGTDGATDAGAGLDTDVVTFTGTEGESASVRFASSKPGRPGLERFRLRPTGGEAEHLTEGAVVLPGRPALPAGWQVMPGGEGLQLTTDRR